jgi:hypothetical protein
MKAIALAVISSNAYRASFLSAALLVVACTEHVARRPVANSTAAPPPVTESPGALAMRHETQESLDRARVAFQWKHFETMEAELDGAAAYLRTEAQETEGDIGLPLRRVAAELDSLAERVACGDPPTASVLDRAFIDVNRVEARYHLLRAGGAIARGETDRAGAELTTSVDHLERAVQDAGHEADPTVWTAITDARTLVGEMRTGLGLVPNDARTVTEQLEVAIDRVGGRAYETPRKRR